MARSTSKIGEGWYIADIHSTRLPVFMTYAYRSRLTTFTLFIICAVLLFSACSSTRDFKAWKAPEETLMKIDSICNAQIETGHFPGLAIGVASAGKKVWSKGYGYANLESRTAVDPDDHLFRIGSVSKTVTAAAMARMYERGDIKLDIPIATYYKACPADKQNLTLRQVSGHLAGIRHYEGTEFFSNIQYTNVMDPLDVFIHDTLRSKPGEKFSYSTYAWTLVSAVMEKAGSTPFTAIVKAEVNAPLHLTDLKPDQKDSTGYQRVTFYEFQQGVHQKSLVVNNSNKWAGGGYLCSAEDLAKFGYALVEEGYLKEETIEEFSRSQTTNDGKKTDNGIGLFSGTDAAGRPWIGHSGGSVGGTSMLLIYPQYDLVIVTLVNMGSAQMAGLAAKIADIILAAEKKKG